MDIIFSNTALTNFVKEKKDVSIVQELFHFNKPSFFTLYRLASFSFPMYSFVFLFLFIHLLLFVRGNVFSFILLYSIISLPLLLFLYFLLLLSINKKFKTNEASYKEQYIPYSWLNLSIVWNTQWIQTQQVCLLPSWVLYMPILVVSMQHGVTHGLKSTHPNSFV